MYGSKYDVLWALLVVFLFVVIPLCVVLRRRGLTWWKILPVITISSLGVLVLFVIVSTAATVRLASDGASAPLTEPVNLPDTVVQDVGSASGPGLARKDLGY
jgi:hypothetical protein